MERAAPYSIDKKSYFAMVHGYTYDGGHLNEYARKIIAGKLLLLLVNIK